MGNLRQTAIRISAIYKSIDKHHNFRIHEH